MLLAPLPFEYVSYLDHNNERGERKRRARSRPTGTRVRRAPGKAWQEPLFRVCTMRPFVESAVGTVVAV